MNFATFKKEYFNGLMAIREIADFVKLNDVSEKEMFQDFLILVDFKDELERYQKSRSQKFYPILKIDLQRRIHKLFVFQKPLKGRNISDEIYPFHNKITLEQILKNNFHVGNVIKNLSNIISGYFYSPQVFDYRGIYLYGETNSGKSLCLKALCNKFLEKGRDVAFLPVAKFSTWCISKLKEGGLNDRIDHFKKVDLLVLDDLGGEVIRPWFRDEIFMELLIYRHEHKLLTCFSSILNLTDLEKIEARSPYANYPDNYKAKRLVSKIKLVAKIVRMPNK